RPSILATPSPISRTTPTFCFAAPTLAPVIWASISCRRLLISGNGVCRLKTLFEGGKASLDAAVIDIAADFDPQAAEQGVVLGKRDIQTGAIEAPEVRLDTGLQVGGERNGAFDFGGAAVELEFHEALKVRKDGNVAAGLELDGLVNCGANAVLVQNAVHEAAPKEFLGFAARLFGNF